MGVRHRLPAGDDGFPRGLRQGSGRHLPGAHRHHLARDRWRKLALEFAGIGVGGKDQGTTANLALRRGHDPAVVLAQEARGRRARKDARTAIHGSARQPARQRQRVDVAAGPVPEAAEPGIGAEHFGHILARQEFHRRAGLRPLPHAALGDLDAAGRMHRLDPTGLLLLGLDLVATCGVEQGGSAVAQQRDEALAGGPMPGDDVFRIGPGQRRDYLPVVAARAAPAGFGGFHDGNVNAGFAQMQRGGKAGETRADDDDVGLPGAHKLRQFGPRRRHRGPQRFRHADVLGWH